MKMFSVIVILGSLTIGLAGPVFATDTFNQLGNPLVGDVNKPGDAKGVIMFDFFGRVLNSIIGVAGALALIVITYGGIRWLTAGGNEEKITEAKKIIFLPLLGLIIIFAAYAIVNFVLQATLVSTGVPLTAEE